MKIVAHGSITIITGHTTVIANLEKSDQIFPISEHDFRVEIAPDLIAKGVRLEDDFWIIIPGHTTVVVNTRSIFKRLEIVPFTKDETKNFFLSLVSDPDVASVVKQFGSTAKDRSHDFIEDINAVLDVLPEDGLATQLVKHLEGAQWAQAILEILDAIQIALPEKWQALSDLITPSGLAWLSGKLK